MNGIEYILRITDFETTGIPKDDVNHSVMEAAYLDMSAKDKTIVDSFQTLVAPTTPLDIEAQAVHHITEQEALSCGVMWGECEQLLLKKKDNQDVIYVAHNAKFEQEFFNPEGVKWIDTYKVALKLYPDAPSHSNQVLKYYLQIFDNQDHHPPHRALPDCFVTSEILLVMAKELSFNDMIQITKQPPYYTKLTFGKHKGEKYEDVPMDYLQWLLNQKEMDKGVHAACNRVMIV